MDPFFKVFPSQGYRNSQFQILKSNYGYLKVSISKDQKIIKQITLDRNTSVAIFSLDETGSFQISCEVNSVVYTESIFVFDSLRFGSSILKSTTSIYSFDSSNYSFLVFKDRIQIYDQTLNRSFVENGISPSFITETLTKGVFLFKTNVNNSPQRLVTYGLFSTKYFKFVWEYLEEAIEVYFDNEDKILWIYDLNNQSISGYQLEQDDDNSLKLKIQVKGVKSYSFFNNCSDILWIKCEEEIVIIHLKSFKVFTQKKNSYLYVSENGFSISRESDTEIVYTNYRDFNTQVISIPVEIKFKSYYSVFIGDDLLSDVDHVKDEVRSLYSKHMPGNDTVQDKNITVSLDQNDIINKRVIICDVFPSKDGIYIMWKEYYYNVKILTYEKNSFSGFNFQEFNPFIESKSFYLNRSETVSKANMLPNSVTFYDILGNFEIFNVPTSSISSSQDLHILHKGKLVNILKDVYESIIYKNAFLIIRFGNFGDNYSIFAAADLKDPLITNLVIYNFKYIKSQNVIWYSKHDKIAPNEGLYVKLNSLDLESGKFRNSDFNINVEKSKIHDSIFSKYIVNSDGQICSSKNGTVIDSVFGNILSISNRLHKGFVKRGEIIYFFKFDFQNKKYTFCDIKIESNFIKESYLSPKGNLLVVNKKLDEFEVLDVYTGELVRFFSGKFLEFSQEGNLVFSEKNRNLVIFDPVTFLEIPTGNYQYFRWKSPDGLLFAQLTFTYKYFNKLELINKSKEEFQKFVTNFNSDERVEIQKELFLKHPQYFKSNKVYQSNLIRLDHVYEVKKFIQIGSVKFPSKLVEIELPSNLVFLNYVSFSFDNKYVGLVGKPQSNGMILIYELDFNQFNGEIVVGRRFLNFNANLATWTCGFSRKNLFATYDSAPQTYLFDVDKLFDNLESAFVPSILTKKNYLTFSPSGDFFAMSEQGYDPITMGGSGHQQSSVIHLAKSIDNKIIRSFREHGDEIKKNNGNVIFVAFSEDESKLMSLSTDGVVIVRNLKN
jgi:hypothetical protein